MSKDSLKPSINTPEEGIKNAEEGNKLKSSISTNSEGIEQANKSNTSQNEVPQFTASEPKPKKKRILTDTKEMLGLRVGTAAAGAALVGAKVVSAAAKIRANLDVAGAINDLQAASDIAKGMGKAAGPGDKLINQKGKIKEEGAKSPGLVDKAIKKIRTLPGGNATANILDKTYKTLTSKSVLRVAKAGGAVASMVVNPTPVGIVAGALSLGAIGFNVAKETLEVRENHHLNIEKKNLESIKENKQKQARHIVNFLAVKNSVLKEEPDLQKKTDLEKNKVLQEFLDSKLTGVYPKQPSPNIPFEGSKWKELAKAVRDSMLENASLMLEGVGSGSIVGMVAAAATGLINTGSEADSNLVRREQRNDKINQINTLKLNTGEYKNEKELKELERQERINTAVLEEFLSNTPNLDKLTKVQLEEGFATKQKEVEARPEFAPPAEKSNYEKVKSAVKAGAGYFIESQFGDLKELYGKREEKAQTPIAPNVANKVQKPEQSKAHEQAQQQAHNMQENLTHGKISGYSNSITPPQTVKSVSKNQESSRSL